MTSLPDGFLEKAKKLGFESATSLLLNTPVSYTDNTKICNSISDYQWQPEKILKVMLVKTPSVNNVGKVPRVNICVTDGEHQIYGAVFGGTHSWLHQKANSIIHVRSKFQTYNNTLQLKNIELIPEHEVGVIVPNYKAAKDGFSVGELKANMPVALYEEAANGDALLESKMQCSTRELFERTGGIYHDSATFFANLHQPTDQSQCKLAQLFVSRATALQALLKREKELSGQERHVPRSTIVIPASLIADVIGKLPYSLTGDQMRAIEDIAKDLKSPKPMNRLLSGDVGCGKTMVYAVGLVCAKMLGKNTCIMAPNTLLAKQVANEIEENFSHLGVRVELITGDRVGDVNLSDAPILVGTSAIEHWLKKNPHIEFDVVVIDEQQKFGQAQRNSIIRAHTNCLNATATAIPKTSANVAFVGQDVSVIEQCPVVKKIETGIVLDKSSAFNRLLKCVSMGNKIAVLYPTKNSNDKRKAVESGFEAWKKHFPDRVVMIHGGMTAAEKKNNMQKLTGDEISVIVASSVLEIGLTIPNLRAMLVVDADKYGASTLHQLRGRLARSGGYGLFLMQTSKHYSELKENTTTRLNLLVNSSSGFEIANGDLENRGFGVLESAASKQKGYVDGLFANNQATTQSLRELLDNAVTNN